MTARIAFPGPCRSPATIGVFDGVHLGHQEVFRPGEGGRGRLGRRLRGRHLRQPSGSSCARRAPKLLTTLDQKLELIAEQGLDYAYVIRFDAERAATRPEVLVEQVFIDALHVRAIVVGEDFHFGGGRAGNVEALRTIGAEWDFEVHALELIRHRADAREPVSSTRSAGRWPAATSEGRGHARPSVRGAGRAARRPAGRRSVSRPPTSPSRR
ncbi:MAG: hypothetical protein R2695_11875 [Acidimicrobiales bacterium]